MHDAFLLLFSFSFTTLWVRAASVIGEKTGFCFGAPGEEEINLQYRDGQAWWKAVWHRATFSQVNQAFFRNDTTAHGFRGIYEEGSQVRKVFWWLFVLFSLCFTLFLSHDIIADYKSKPLVTTVDIATETEVQFPAVTVCSLNGFRLNTVTDPTATKYRTKKVRLQIASRQPARLVPAI